MKKSQTLNKYWTDIYYHLHYPHEDNVSHQVIRILQHVQKKKNVGISEIADSLRVSHNTASGHVKRIINKRYLTKQRDHLDERKVILCLTEEGKELLHRNTSLDEERLTQILNDMNEEEKEMIEKVFKMLSERARQCM